MALLNSMLSSYRSDATKKKKGLVTELPQHWLALWSICNRGVQVVGGDTREGAFGSGGWIKVFSYLIILHIFFIHFKFSYIVLHLKYSCCVFSFFYYMYFCP
jgi:hypothetical protein